MAWTAFELAGIPGTILCGWISDRLFEARRAPATILFMALTLAGLVVYGLNGSGPYWIDVAALIAIGFFIYGPIMIDRATRARPRAEEGGGHGGGFYGFFRLLPRLGAFGRGRGVDRGKVWLERRVRDDDRVLRARDGVQRADAGAAADEGRG